MNTYQDHRLLKFFQEQLKTLGLTSWNKQQLFETETPDYFIFKKFARCYHQANFTNAGVTILKNSKNQVSVTGLVNCQNTWACPVCSSRVMNKFALNVADTIDMFSQKNYVGIMITFTIWHLNSFPGQLTFNCLQNTWKRFTQFGKSNVNVTKNNRSAAAFTLFRQKYQVDYFVKVIEATYGLSGWHPHIHAIYFLPKHKFLELQENLEEETKILNHAWQTINLRQTIKQAKLFNLNMTEEQLTQLYNQSLQNIQSNGQVQSPITFSTDNKGKLRIQKSSTYISGWSGDMEIGQQHYKKTRGQYSRNPFEILESAYIKYNAGNQNYIKDLNLFLEYCRMTHRKIRCQWSPGIWEQLRVYKQTIQYKEIIKKKRTHATEHWEIVAWFSSNQWLQIYQMNNHHLLLLILSFAKYENGYELICELCHEWNLSPPSKSCPQSEAVLKLYNKAA